MTVELYNGDCIEEMKKLKDSSIDFILTDLPYNTLGVTKKHKKIKKDDLVSIHQINWDNELNLVEIFKQFKRILKDDGVIALTAVAPFTYKLYQASVQAGLIWKYNWCWNKNSASNFANCKKQPLKIYEEVMIFYKNKGRYFPQLVQSLGSKKYKTKFFNKFTNDEISSEKVFDEIIIPYFQNKILTENNVNTRSETSRFGAKNINKSLTNILKDVGFKALVGHRGCSTSLTNNTLQTQLADQIYCSQVGVQKHGGYSLPKILTNDNGYTFDFEHKTMYRQVESKTGYPKNIINFKLQQGKIQNRHPTQKPQELLKFLIQTYTNQGDVVLDATMGSGSTGVAAVNLNRNFIGIEITKLWFDIAKNRIKQ